MDMHNKEQYSVLLDTSFLIRLLSVSDPLHGNALEYFKHFLNNDIPMKVSTISVAEYCVKGQVDELPLKNIEILTFNLSHARTAGEFASILFDKNRLYPIVGRKIIPNDVKLFAQAHSEQSIKHFVTSDVESAKLISLLSSERSLSFDHWGINVPLSEREGLIPF